jgi:hypothetical protein
VLPLSPAAAMPWAQQSLMSSIYKVLLFVNLMPRWSAGGPHLNAYSAQSLTVAAIVVCAVFSAAFAVFWLRDLFAADDSPRSAWRARFFWYLAPPLLTGFYAPMAASLMAPLACAVSSQKLWMNTTLEVRVLQCMRRGRRTRYRGGAACRRCHARRSTIVRPSYSLVDLPAPQLRCGSSSFPLLQCWSGGHVGLLIAGLVTLLPFIAISGLFALTLVDRRVSVGGKDNATCAVHGRVDAGLQVLRLGLAAFFVLGYDSNAWLTVTVSIAAGLVWLGAYTWWLPFYRLRTNQGCAIGASVFLCAGIAAALSVATSSGEENGGSILFLFLILPVAYSCYRCVLAVQQARCTTPTVLHRATAWIRSVVCLSFSRVLRFHATLSWYFTLLQPRCVPLALASTSQRPQLPVPRGVEDTLPAGGQRGAGDEGAGVGGRQKGSTQCVLGEQGELSSGGERTAQRPLRIHGAQGGRRAVRPLRHV